ncbi:hypothetical protein PCE1_001636 [Barthelona sp. PCE]
MDLLTYAEKEALNVAIGCEANHLAIVKVYKCFPGTNTWVDTGIVGPAALLIESTVPVIGIFALPIFSLYFHQEIYEGFKLNEMGDMFVAFEASDCIVGLCFTDKQEYDYFLQIAKFMITNNDADARRRRNEPEPTIRERLFPKKEKKKIQISNPIGFRHTRHVGFDTEGLQMFGLTNEWINLFKGCGLKKKDLENPETREAIQNVIKKYGGAPNISSAPKRKTVVKKPRREVAPPLANVPAPPAGVPAPPANIPIPPAGVPAPPANVPTPPSGAPAPPANRPIPQPMPSQPKQEEKVEKVEGHGNLMADILKGGFKLKKVDRGQVSKRSSIELNDLKRMSVEAKGNLQSDLSAALKEIRKYTQTYSDDEEDSDW